MHQYIIFFYILLIFLMIYGIVLKIFKNKPTYDITGKKCKIPFTNIYIPVNSLYLFILPITFVVIFTTDITKVVNLVTILKLSAGILFLIYVFLVIKMNKGVSKEKDE
jgi:hypothetical protein